MATHPIGQRKTTKNPQSLTLCGFLGLRWSLLDRYLVGWGRLNLDFNYMNLMSLYSLLMSVVVQVVVLSEKVPPP